MKPQERFRLGPLATASSWFTLWEALADASRRARAGQLTNREAVAVVHAFRTAASFPLWHQFAAVAYGWDPTHNRFDTSAAQADRFYPRELTADLWSATKAVALELDTTRTKEPRLELDADDFSDVLVHGSVRDALIQDGAKVLSGTVPAPKKKSVIEVGLTRQPRPSSSSSSRLLLAGLAIGGLWLAFGRKKPQPRRARVARRRTKARARYAAT